MQLELIAAISYRSRGIGAAGQLPWHIPSELKHFASVTSNAPNNMINAVIMGKNTWESIPQNKRPLKNRINVVLSRKGIQLEANDEHILVCDSLQGAVEKLSQRKNINKVFVIGGQQVYSEAIKSPNCSKIYITEIYQNYECDTFFPEIDLNRFAQEASSPVMFYNDIAYQHFTFVQKAHSERQDSTVNYDEMSYSDHPEHQYLNLIREILESGIKRGDRTGTGTISLYGKQMKFSLRNDEFPLLTTKRVFWRGVVEELLWFVAGSTNSNLLRDKGIHIWDGNSSKEFLQSVGLGHREEGDLGPVYGFQWRHFGAEYKDMHSCYDGVGVDQLAEAIHTIKTNPTSRRIIVSAWNPADLKKMALPPCHMFMQFFVMDGELSCLMYQRSCDVGLGVPFNIASYSLLTRMMAQVCDLKPGDFIHVMGDTHIYLNHVEALEQQVNRKPFPFPKLKINPAKKDIDSFVFEDFELEGYQCHKTIKMQMAV